MENETSLTAVSENSLRYRNRILEWCHKNTFYFLPNIINSLTRTKNVRKFIVFCQFFRFSNNCFLHDNYDVYKRQ